MAAGHGQGQGGGDAGWITFLLLLSGVLAVSTVVLYRRMDFYRGRGLAESPPDQNSIDTLQTRLEHLPDKAGDCWTLCNRLARRSAESQAALARELDRLDGRRDRDVSEEEPHRH